MNKNTSPLFIAEVSSNHHQNINRCFEFIEQASRIGCGAVKFQLFKVDRLFAPEILAKSELHRKRKDWELPNEFIKPLAEHCKLNNIQFACTPFDLEAVETLTPLPRGAPLKSSLITNDSTPFSKLKQL